MTRLLLTALAFLAIAAPVASADTGVEPSTTRPLSSTRVMESLRIADAFIGHPAPCPVRVYAATVPEMVAFTGVTSAAGATYLDGCGAYGVGRIWLSDAMAAPTVENRIRECSDIVHERWHAEGAADDEVADSVMNGVEGPVVYACYRRFCPAGWGRRWRDANPDVQWAVRP